MHPLSVVLTAFALVLVAAAAWTAAMTWSSLPVVYRSWSTRECYDVASPRGDVSCDNLPEKYEVIWVR